MAEGPVTLWSDGVRRFTLEQKDDCFELALHEHDRIVRREGCTSEHQARDIAQRWLIALEATENE
jgi:hypothetical protein